MNPKRTHEQAQNPAPHTPRALLEKNRYQPLSVSCGEPQNIIFSGVSFGDVAERIAKLQKSESLAVIGSLKPNEWPDKTTGETKHGMNITASNSLSVYDIQKKRSPPGKVKNENRPRMLFISILAIGFKAKWTAAHPEDRKRGY